MNIVSSTWRDRRVLITGHTGFKGGWLSLWLASLGARVTGYALESHKISAPNFFTAAKIENIVNSVIADIRDYPRLLDTIKQTQPDIIFHLAAQSLVRRSYADPRETYETNVMGTVNVLEAARQIPSVRTMIVVTSDKCYENNISKTGHIEDDRIGGHDPYSSSKACAELVTSAFRQSYFSRASDIAPLVATVRAGNVIGGGDWAPDRLIPDLLRAFSKNEFAQIRNPNAVRPWQHVLEPLSGYMMLAERLIQQDRQFSGAWNFGPSNLESASVGQIADTVCKRWGHGAAWQHDDIDHPHETHFLQINSDKARAQLGWQAILPLQAALALTLDWYGAHEMGQDMNVFSLQQINHYVQEKNKHAATQKP